MPSAAIASPAGPVTRSRSASSARPTRTRGRSCSCEAAQLVDCEIRVRIHGEVPRDVRRARSCALDRRGVVELAGAFSHAELPEILAGLDAAVIPSLWWDCAPLVVAECLAGRVPVVGAEHGRHPRLRRARAATACCSTGARRPRSRPRSHASRRARPARAPAGRHRRPRAVRRLRRRARGDLRRRSRAARAGRRGPPVAVRWVGDQSTRVEPLDDQPRGRRRRARRAPGARASSARATDGPLGDAPTPHTPEVEVRHQWPPDFTRPGRRPARADPALGVRVAAARLAGSRCSTTSTRSGCRPRSRARCTSRPASSPTACTSCRTASTSSRSARTARAPSCPRRRLRLLFVGGTISRKGADVLLVGLRRGLRGPRRRAARGQGPRRPELLPRHDDRATRCASARPRARCRACTTSTTS